MEIEIYWTDFAKKELNKIFDYFQQKVNLKLARKLTTQIVSDTDILKSSPEIGTREENLKSRPQKFRYIVSTNYKIIYWYNSEMDRVEIVDVFDTRQNPKKIKRNKRH